MKRIITAMGNNYLNERLRNETNYEIIGKDIQYKEGILEFLSENNEAQVLILSQILEGNIEFKELIERIFRLNENIEIIVFVEEDDDETMSFLYKKGIYKIYQNNQIDLRELIESLGEGNVKNTELLNEEIRKLKRIIAEQKSTISVSYKMGRITSVLGPPGVRQKCGHMYIV